MATTHDDRMPLTTYRIDRSGADRMLVLLHGWSAEQHHLAAYVPLVDPDERFTAVAPRALHDLPEGDGASWYDRTAGGADPSSFQQAVDAVTRFVDDELEAAGIPHDRCVLAGFSQGGFVALALALGRGAPAYAGVWAMCCALPEFDGIDLDSGSGAGRPALIQIGKHDQIITPDRGRAAAAAMADGGWGVTEAEYDMAHSQTIEMMVDARAWLAAICDG